MKHRILPILLALPLGAEEAVPLEHNASQITLGAYNQSLTNGYGKWQGLTLDGTYDSGEGGPWLASIVTYDRKDGDGTIFSIGKYQTLGSLGFMYAGVGSSTGANYLPTLQASLDLDFAVGGGWVAGLGLSHSEIRDGHRNTLLQAGPTLYLGNWISTLRYQRNISNPGRLESSAVSLDVRHGASDREAWQSLHVGWGGEAYEAMNVMQDVTGRGGSVMLTAHQPITAQWAFKGTVEWGEKQGAYRYWGGTLALTISFN